MNSADETADRALQHGLAAVPLSAAALQRIRAATYIEWRATTRSAPRPRRWRQSVAAAALAMVAIGVGWFAMLKISTPELGTTLGRLERVEKPGVFEHRTLSSNLRILAGDMLRSGQTVQVQGGALVALVGGGTLRLAANTGIEIKSDRYIKVIQGAVYLDLPATMNRADRFVIETPVGNFEHIGTQFEVVVDGDQTRLRVREGSVRWRSVTAETVANAGTEVMFDRSGELTRRPISGVGRDWAWTEALAQDFTIENRSLADFLNWVARETGRKLVLVDSATRQRVATTRLHGSVEGLTLIEALSSVIASTSLRFDLADASIRVSSVRESPPPTK
jgi:ferric-dicitrate binding protein FerR (iron transport regulator)